MGVIGKIVTLKTMNASLFASPSQPPSRAFLSALRHCCRQGSFSTISIEKYTVLNPCDVGRSIFHDDTSGNEDSIDDDAESLATLESWQSKSSTNWSDTILTRAKNTPGVGSHELEKAYRIFHSRGSPRRSGNTLSYDLQSRWNLRDKNFTATSKKPGPGHYHTQAFERFGSASCKGPKIPLSTPATPLDMAIKRAAETPSPQDCE